MSARAPAVPVAPAPAEPADVEELSGPDDADVAVDVDVDVDPGMRGRAPRQFLHHHLRPLDLGQSPSQAFVLVDGDSTFANGGIDDVTLAAGSSARARRCGSARATSATWCVIR
jgi:hypothetical protein